MEYHPQAFDLGYIVTMVAGIAYAAALVFWAILALGAYLTKKAA
jgi:hypothetical protein